MAEKESIIEIAKAEIGYLEKSKKAVEENYDVLYEKTEGAGNDNMTKYAAEMDAMQVYNTPKQGYAWCKVFVDWCFTQALGLDRAGELLYGWTAGVTQEYNWFKNNGRISNTPEIGDLIIFGNCDHIGIVTDYDDTRVYTIEGNTSGTTGLVANGGAVAQKSYSRYSSYIKCYCRPAYEESPEPQPTPPEPSGDPQIRDIQEWLIDAYGLDIVVDGYYGVQTKQALIMAYQMELNAYWLDEEHQLAVDGIFGQATKNATPVLKYGNEGDLVCIVQCMLYCRGYNPIGIDGLYYSGTEKAIKTFQSNHGLSVDGIYGRNTGYKLFN